MYIFLKFLLLWTIISITVMADTKVMLSDKNSYKVLCYHNVVDKITDPKIMNVTTDQLIAHFKWLKVNGYNVISIDDILKAKAGTKDLPEKAVLLTFDDGYVSFYTRIYPLLKLYNYHGVYALVGKWQETPENQNFLYGTLPRSRKMLLSWKEINEMKDSGLIEFASHTYDSHHGVPSNPQGNTHAAMTTIKYDKRARCYESTQAYLARVEADIKKSSDVIYQHTGIRPRAIAWPYGAYNGVVQKIAAKYGMPITLTLDDGINSVNDLSSIKRILIGNDAKFSNFYWNMQDPKYTQQRYLFVDLDQIYNPNPKIADKNLGRIIEKIRALGVSTAVVKGYSDRDHDGLADILYFPNQIMSYTDLLNRVAWQLQSRAGLEDVYIQMPISAFETRNQKLSLHKINDQVKIMKIYSDMAKYSFFKGIVFDDTYGDPDVSTNDTIRFTYRLKESMRDFTINLKTAIMMDAQDAINPKNYDLTKFLTLYDHTFLNTQNLLTNSRNGETRLTELINIIKQYPKGLEKSAFIFTEKNSSNKVLTEHMRALILQKAMNFGYQPKQVLNNNLNYNELIKVLSLKSSPFE